MAEHGVCIQNGLEVDDEQVQVVKRGADGGVGSQEDPPVTPGVDDGGNKWGENDPAFQEVNQGTNVSGKLDITDELVQNGVDGLGYVDVPINPPLTTGVDDGVNKWGENDPAFHGVDKGTDISRTLDITFVENGVDRLDCVDVPNTMVEEEANGFGNEGVNEITEVETLRDTHTLNNLSTLQKFITTLKNLRTTLQKKNFKEIAESFEQGSSGLRKDNQIVNEVKNGGNLFTACDETRDLEEDVTNDFVIKKEESVEVDQVKTNETEEDDDDVPAKTDREETNSEMEIDFTREEIHIKKIELGSFEIDTTYPAAYPDPLNKHSYVSGQLFACEFCLQFTDSPDNLKSHKLECIWTQPCGVEIYNKGDMSVFEIDGTREKVYCECLCVISKLFLDKKRKQCNVDEFVFYVLTINDPTGKRLAGYFSKEKAPNGNHNVSCLLVLPHYQRQGFGRFLIDFSYFFSRVVKVPGTPERPLSNLGMISYQSYWKDVIGEFLYNHISEKSILIRTISEDTGIDPYDVAVTLQMMNMVKHRRTKVSIVVKHRALAECVERIKDKNHIILDEECLQWTPWVQENTKETEKYSRLLRKNAIHNFNVVKSEEKYFSLYNCDDAKPPPNKKAR